MALSNNEQIPEVDKWTFCQGGQCSGWVVFQVVGLFSLKSDATM